MRLIFSLFTHVISRKTACLANPLRGLQQSCFPLYQMSTLKDPSHLNYELKGQLLEKYLTNKNTISTLHKFGIKELFPIQCQTYNLLFKGEDLLASDRTGSGKTFAYSIPVLERLRQQGLFSHDSRKRTVKFLILCPTRELALQVTKEMDKLSDSERDFYTVTLYGGSPISRQYEILQRGVDVIVATPGRLIDMIKRDAVDLSNLRVVCVDQADTMLQKGFKLDVEEIYRLIRRVTKEPTQNIMFSATIPPWVNKIASQFMSPNKRIVSMVREGQNRTPSTVRHLACQSKEFNNFNEIQSIISMYSTGERILIFVPRKIDANVIANKFENKAVPLHGDISQSQRQFHLRQFKSGQKQILVATDVASRGLDIPNVELIIQINPPETSQSYIHRSGRAGRAGRSGTSIILYKREQLGALSQIQKDAQVKFHLIELDSNDKTVAFDDYVKTNNINLRDAEMTYKNSRRGSKSFSRDRGVSFSNDRGGSSSYSRDDRRSSFGDGDRNRSSDNREQLSRPLRAPYNEDDQDDQFSRQIPQRQQSFNETSRPTFDRGFRDQSRDQPRNQYRDQSNQQSSRPAYNRGSEQNCEFEGYIGSLPANLSEQALQNYLIEKNLKPIYVRFRMTKPNESNERRKIAFLGYKNEVDLQSVCTNHMIDGNIVNIRQSRK